MRVSNPVLHGGDRHPHSCRKPGLTTPGRLRGTFATIHSETGTPVQVIQALLGPKSATTTMLYLGSHQEKATEQQAKVAERMGFGGKPTGRL